MGASEIQNILVSFALASPVTYYLLLGWLDQFAYHIGINPLLFLLGGLIAMAIALTTMDIIPYDLQERIR